MYTIPSHQKLTAFHRRMVTRHLCAIQTINNAHCLWWATVEPINCLQLVKWWDFPGGASPKGPVWIALQPTKQKAELVFLFTCLKFWSLSFRAELLFILSFFLTLHCLLAGLVPCQIGNWCYLTLPPKIESNVDGPYCAEVHRRESLNIESSANNALNGTA